MAKCSYEFKKKVVDAYLNGEGGYVFLTETYGIAAWSNIKKWVLAYSKMGDEGLIRSRKNQIIKTILNYYLQILLISNRELEDKIMEMRIVHKDFGYRRMLGSFANKDI